MCGIVGAVAARNIVPILVDGLQRLEYRGYDSAGVAVVDDKQQLGLCRTIGKVAELEAKLEENPLQGQIGVAHTRWATHGGVTQKHRHVECVVRLYGRCFPRCMNAIEHALTTVALQWAAREW